MTGCIVRFGDGFTTNNAYDRKRTVHLLDFIYFILVIAGKEIADDQHDGDQEQLLRSLRAVTLTAGIRQKSRSFWN